MSDCYTHTYTRTHTVTHVHKHLSGDDGRAGKGKMKKHAGVPPNVLSSAAGLSVCVRCTMHSSDAAAHHPNLSLPSASHQSNIHPYNVSIYTTAFLNVWVCVCAYVCVYLQGDPFSVNQTMMIYRAYKTLWAGNLCVLVVAHYSRYPKRVEERTYAFLIYFLTADILYRKLPVQDNMRHPISYIPTPHRMLSYTSVHVDTITLYTPCIHHTCVRIYCVYAFTVAYERCSG